MFNTSAPNSQIVCRNSLSCWWTAPSFPKLFQVLIFTLTTISVLPNIFTRSKLFTLSSIYSIRTGVFSIIIPTPSLYFPILCLSVYSFPSAVFFLSDLYAASIFLHSPFLLPFDVALYGTSAIFSFNVMPLIRNFLSNLTFLQIRSASKYFLCKAFSGYKCFIRV